MGMRESIMDKIRERIRKIRDRGNCPICGYKLKMCQCRFGGSAHPDRYKNMDVVNEHLYLLGFRQLIHVIRVQSDWEISYGDADKERMLNRLKSFGSTE